MRVLVPAIVVLLLSPMSFAQDAAPAAPSSTQSAASSYDDSSAKARPQIDLTPDAQARLSQEQMRELTRVVTENYRDNYRRERDYTYIERDVENSVDGKGGTKSSEVRTYEVLEIYGEQVRKLIEKDDKPLDAKEAAKEDQ